MNCQTVMDAIRSGRTALGIELGSTRIKAVLISDTHQVLATGSYMVIRNVLPLNGSSFDFRALPVTAGLGAALWLWPRLTKKKLSPIALICVSAALGVIFYSI